MLRGRQLFADALLVSGFPSVSLRLTAPSSEGARLYCLLMEQTAVSVVTPG